MTAWWLWVTAGVLLAGLEVLVPGFIFLGFAAGAVLTGLLLLVGIEIGGAPLLLLFALLSLASWAGLRRAFHLGGGRPQPKIWTTDINDG